VQHALRAYTPRDRKALKAAAETFRANPKFDTEAAIMEVGTGEALVSTLMKKGIPSVVERTLIRPPSSHLGPCDDATRKRVIQQSPLAGLYEAAVDRESAYEILTQQAQKAAEAASREDLDEPDEESWADFKRQQDQGRDYHAEEDAPSWRDRAYKSSRRYKPAVEPKRRKSSGRSSRSDSVSQTLVKSVVRTAGTQIARQLVRGVLGGLFRGR